MMGGGGSLRVASVALAGLGLAAGCAFDTSLREYLDAHFWLPFSKEVSSFEKPGVRRLSEPYAGMAQAEGDTPLARLRAAYQEIPKPELYVPPPAVDGTKLRSALAAARADTSLSPAEREEVQLLDAKIDMRIGEGEGPTSPLLKSAANKLRAFLKSAKTPAFLSEARGWLAHIYFIEGDQTAAGKIYLDELNRDGSNLSRETILTSLRMTYHYDGGGKLVENLDRYFDTPEHAAFAIQLVTNPRSDNLGPLDFQHDKKSNYARIKNLLEAHADLLNSNRGSNALALLGMRTALRMGDPSGALEIAAIVPGDAEIRNEPDFEWMLASAHFLSHDFAGAEAPLLELYGSARATDVQHAAAAYGLCGVYEKTGDVIEQIRFALWLHSNRQFGEPSTIADQGIYWAQSGWDLNLLLEMDAPDSALEAFVKKYSTTHDIELAQYALAVRYAREDRYEESAQIFEALGARERAARMKRAAKLYQEASPSTTSRNSLRPIRRRFTSTMSFGKACNAMRLPLQRIAGSPGKNTKPRSRGSGSSRTNRKSAGVRT
jgi:hypothetical protein